MVRTTALLAATAAFALDAHAESMYPKKSSVLSITGMDYDRLIAKSNYTSVSTTKQRQQQYQ
jgi:protein disulfide-isomerase A6